MEESDPPRASAPDGSGDHSTIITLAGEIIHDMQSRRLSPSLALFADCLGDVRDRIPETFEEQLALLRVVRQSAATHLKKAGKLGFIEDLVEFTASLDRCGEMPGHSLELVIARVQQMDAFAASRYLEGIGRLSHRVRSKGAQRRLIALLCHIEDPDLPFAWSDGEWRVFGDLVKRQQENVARLLAPPPVVREEAAGGSYRSGDSIDDDDDTNQLHWRGPQIDLVFYVSLLKQLGFLDEKTSDALVARLFRYESKAKKPAGVLKTLRFKLAANDIHPSRSALRQAIRILSERLEAADRAALNQDSEP